MNGRSHRTRERIQAGNWDMLHVLCTPPEFREQLNGRAHYEERRIQLDLTQLFAARP